MADWNCKFFKEWFQIPFLIHQDPSWSLEWNLIINNIYHDGDDDVFLPFYENVCGASCEIFYVNGGGDDSFFFLTDFYDDFYGDS